MSVRRVADQLGPREQRSSRRTISSGEALLTLPWSHEDTLL
jgi:hypothetical protein